MKIIWTIFRKELTDSIRDRRTLFTMVIIPLLMFPILIGISSRMMVSQIRKAQEKTLIVGLLSNGNAAGLRDKLLSNSKLQIIEGLDLAEGRALIENDSLEAYIIIDADFDEDVAENKQGKISVYYKSSEKNEIEHERILNMVEDYEKELRRERFAVLGLDQSIIHTIDLGKYNLASIKERLAGSIGGFLPYLFIIFCFTGSMYPAIDLAAGEKERGTLETLLTSPVGKFEILLGKFGVVVLTGLISAAISIVGMYIGVLQMKEIPSELMNSILGILETRSIVLLLSLLLPLTAFFAAILLSLSIIAKSFKEAQSILTPMMIVVIVPAFIGLLPGMELTATTALIPILNVSLATKSIIAGNLDVFLMVEVYLSLLLVAGLSLFVCAKIFQSESNMFRTS
ncbi:MAG: ABC transporter permease [Candidatus Latescibacterota bacterium]